jgi:hypothetical protein
MKNNIFGKGLVFGIVVLFLGMNIVPIVGSLPIEKQVSKVGSAKPLDWEVNWTINGTMGDNGWYISNVIITFTFDNGSPPMRIYYKLHAGDPWTEYTAPITISSDGIYELYIMIIDQYGNEYVYGPFCFKIDKTPPAIWVQATSLNHCRGASGYFPLRSQMH